MPGWYWKLCMFSVIALLLSAWGDLVLYTSLATVFLAMPLWLLCVNLWIIAAMIAPLAWAAQRGRPYHGLAVTLCLVAVPIVVAFRIMPDALETVVAQNAETIDGRVEGLPVSIELDRSVWDWNADRCKGLCLRLLEGPNVTWVRVSSANYPPVIYYRAPTAICLERNPAFDQSKPCIQFCKDDGQKPDLWVGERYGSPKHVPGKWDLVWPTGVAKIVIEDRRGSPRLVAMASTVRWERVYPFVLLPAMGAFNGSPGDPISLFRETGTSGELPELADFLARAGLELGPA